MKTIDINDIEEVNPSSQALDLSDIEKVEPVQEEPSALAATAEDVLTSGLKGLTLNLSDEAIAAARAGYESISEKEKYQDLYDKYVEIERQRQKKAQERSPVLSKVSELGGAIAPAFFSGGMATAPRVLSMLPGLGRLAAVGTEATGGIKLAQAALAGAQYGATAAAGETEAPLTSKEGLEQVARGGVFGGTLGGALGAAGLVGGKLVDAGEKTEIGRQMLTAFREARKPGSKTFGAAAKQEQLGIREVEQAQKISQSFLEGQANLGKKIQSTLEEAKDVIISVEDDVLKRVKDQFEKDPPPADRNTLTKLFGKKRVTPDGEVEVIQQGLFDKLENKSITPVEANDLRKILKELIFEKKKEIGSSSTVNALNDLSNDVFSSLKQIPEFEQAIRNYDIYTAGTMETMLGKGISPREVPLTKEPAGPSIKTPERFFSDRAYAKTDLEKEIRQGIRTLGLPGVSAADRVAALTQLEKNVKLINESRPELFKNAGINVDDILKQLKYEADVSATYSARLGYEPQTGPLRQLLGLFTPRGATMSAAAGAGTLSKFASRVASAPEPVIRNIATALNKNPATRHFGEGLLTSLDKPMGVPRAVALFQILSNEHARRTISDLYPGMFEEQ